jgi:hypothetical protein
MLLGLLQVSASVYSRETKLALKTEKNADRVAVINTAGEKALPVTIATEQQKGVSGKVNDQNGDPIPGATVMVKGSTIGIVTDFDGNFKLQVPLDAKTLIFSFVGCKTLELPIGNKTIFNVVLEEVTVGV